ncbi:MAG: invasion associated locus B family protein [Gemmobacter sp.]|nr:invasion associated locus B family protein [Gemmobacter sp.]
MRLEAGQMTSRMTSALLGVAMALTGAMAFAQESTNRVATKTDWSVFTEGTPMECWGVSAPKVTVNSRDGKPVSVRRGDILLFVTFRPGAGAKGEVSFSGGYPFAKGSNVEVAIGSDKFQLFSDGEWAWPANAQDDAALLGAMKRGSEAVVSAKSGRGTETKDTFSLLGFTAAMEEAEKRCK